jgi:hypothetical protein
MIVSIFFIRVKNLYYSLKNVRQNKPKSEVETAIDPYLISARRALLNRRYLNESSSQYPLKRLRRIGEREVNLLRSEHTLATVKLYLSS